MAYSTYETSQEGGQPIELYEFAYGATTYRYTSNQVPVTASGHVYTPKAITRGRLQLANEKGSDRLEVRLPGDDEFVQLFITAVPAVRSSLIIKQLHRTDPAEQVITSYKGAVQNVRFEDDGRRAAVQILPITAAQSRPIPRITFSGLCNHMLYDTRCKIDETSSSWKKSLTVTAVSGSVITVSGAGGFGADFFVRGYVKWNDEYRLVIAQSTDDLTMSHPFVDSPLNQTVTCLAGCLHRRSDCKNKFDNVINFGGFPYVPKKNPFETGID